MSKKKTEWGNQTIGDLSHDELISSKVNIIVANKLKAKDDSWIQAVTKSNRNPEVRAKRAANMPDQTGENNPFYGKQHDQEFISRHSKVMSEKFAGKNNPFYGKNHSEESLKKMRRPRKNTEKMRGPRQQKTCPHCGHVGAGGNMSRYHFDNCRNKQ